MKELIAKAQAGDGETALELYQGLDRCRALLTGNQQAQEENTGDPQLDIWNKRMNRWMEADLAFCKDITQDQIVSRYHWLEKAADLVHPAAMLDYYILLPDIVGGAESAISDTRRVIDKKSRAIGYINTLARQCNYEAINLLASHHIRGHIVDKDEVLGTSYFLVIKRLNLTTKLAPPMLSASDQRKAEILADNFIAANCN